MLEIFKEMINNSTCPLSSGIMVEAKDEESKKGVQ